MRCDASSCLSPSLISAVLCEHELAPSKRDAARTWTTSPSCLQCGLRCVQHNRLTPTMQSIMSPNHSGKESVMADNASFVIRGRRRMNSARPVFRYAKAHWLPPVNRDLAWSEVFSPSTPMPWRTATGASTCRPVVMDADCISVAGQFRPSLPLLPANLMFAFRTPRRSHSVGRDWARNGSAARGSDCKRDGDQKKGRRRNAGDSSTLLAALAENGQSSHASLPNCP